MILKLVIKIFFSNTVIKCKRTRTDGCFLESKHLVFFEILFEDKNDMERKLICPFRLDGAQSCKFQYCFNVFTDKAIIQAMSTIKRLLHKIQPLKA